MNQILQVVKAIAEMMANIELRNHAHSIGTDLKRYTAFAFGVFAIAYNCDAQTTTWSGGLGNTDWNASANWSNGVPTSSSEVVLGAGANPQLPGNVTIQSLVISGGSLDLNGQVLTIQAGNAAFTAGSTTGSGTITFNNAADVTFGSGFTIDAMVAGSAANIFFNGTTFNRVVTLTKTGTLPNTSSGGNTFGSTFHIINDARNINGVITLANTDADTYNGDAIFEIKIDIDVTAPSSGGTNGIAQAGIIDVSYGATANQFSGNVYVIADDPYLTPTMEANVVKNSSCDDCGIYFGRNEGTSFIDGELSDDYNGSKRFERGVLFLRNITQTNSAISTILDLDWRGSRTDTDIFATWPYGDTHSSNALKLYIEDCTFAGGVDIYASNMFLQESVFNGAESKFIKSLGGDGVMSCYGGNSFSSTNTIFGNETTSIFRLANNVADEFNGHVTFRYGFNGARFEPAYNGNNFFRGNIYADKDLNFPGHPSAAILFGGGDGWAILQSSTQQIIQRIHTQDQPNLLFRRLRINNPNDVVLSTANSGISIDIHNAGSPGQGILDFTSGKIVTNSNHVRFLNDATAINASNASYVEGLVIKVGNDPFTFPVGQSDYYRPLSISAPSSTSARFSAEYFQSETPGYTGTRESTLEAITSHEYWNFRRVSGTDNVNVTLSWGSFLNADISNKDIDALTVARWNQNTNQWIDFDHNDLSSGSTNPATFSGLVTSGGPIDIFNSTASQNYITLAFLNPPPAPAASNLEYCLGDQSSALTATGATDAIVKWYTAISGGTALLSAPVPSTTSVGTTTYYVSQEVRGLESADRIEQHVTVKAIPLAPGVSTTPVSYVLNQSASPLSASGDAGSTLRWTDNATGASMSSPATPATNLIGTATYSVTQEVLGCLSPSAQVTVIVAPPAPGTSAIGYCQHAVVTDPLTATGMATANFNWYSNATGGTALGSVPVPSTATAGTTAYYVSQEVNGLESARASVDVVINAKPAEPVVSSVDYILNQSASQLSANGSFPLRWGALATLTSIAPTPVTNMVGITTYEVRQDDQGCLSDPAQLTVTVAPPAPGTSPIGYCQHEVVTDPLTATGLAGAGFHWYSFPSGGTALGSVPVPTTTTTGTTVYYVSQEVNGLESARASIDVVINAKPAEPVVSSVDYILNQNTSPLSANGSFPLRWGALPTLTSAAPTPVTNMVGITTYEVRQDDQGCLSNPAQLTVTVAPPAPNASSVGYCLNQPSATLEASGMSGAVFHWYDGSGTSIGLTAPTPTTSAIGVTTYQVSQEVNNIESDRATVVVSVSSKPVTPVVPTQILNHIVGDVPGELSAVASPGHSLLWYAADMSPLPSAPTPTTSVVGTLLYYVSQATLPGTCESDKVSVIINVSPVPEPLVQSNSVNYCVGDAAEALLATPNGLGTIWWCEQSTGDQGTQQPPVADTDQAGSKTYYVCSRYQGYESTRVPITITVNSVTSPLVVSFVRYELGQSASPLSATGVQGGTIIWENLPAGESPMPSTAQCGVQTFTVRQQIGNCVSDPVSIQVIVVPPVPIVQNKNYCVGDEVSPMFAESVNGGTITWYDASGSELDASPLPLTDSPGIIEYYVAQQINGIESDRIRVTATISDIPAAPTFASRVITYLQNESASPLQPVSSENGILNWYTVPEGGEALLSSPVPDTDNLGSTYYYASYSNNGCEGPRAPILIIVTSEAILHSIDFKFTGICQNKPYAFQAMAKNNADYSYEWYCFSDETFPEKGAEVSYNFNAEGDHEIQLIAFDAHGHPVASVEKLITIVPCEKNTNAFSPNGDGVNDYWVSSDGSDDVSGSKLVIFNRWGEIVFRSTGNEHVWDGQRNGKILESGTYYYIKERDGRKGALEKGSITLLQ